VREANLKVAGQPRIEPKQEPAAGAIEFSATFEVYPDFKVGGLAETVIERPQVTVDDAAAERTVALLRKQRVTFAAADRPAADADSLTADFTGTIDGQPFAGGQAEGVAFILGEGRMLPEFEAAGRGMRAGESKRFALKFPDDYHGRDVAGKTAEFSLAVKRVEAPQLPALDAEFAKTLGVADGDLGKMRGEVRQNVEREVAKRVEALTRGTREDGTIRFSRMMVHRSISPITISTLALMAMTSDNRAPSQSRGSAARLMNDGGRIRHRTGFAVPSDTR